MSDFWARVTWIAAGILAFGGAACLLERRNRAGEEQPAILRWALVVVAYPVASNLAGGQNGLLFAGILGIGLALLPTRPWVSGCVLAWLTLKPQYGLLLPFALLGLRAWKTAISTSVVTAGLVVVSVAIYGADAWAAFLQGLAGSGERLASGGFTTMRMVTPFAAVYDAFAPWSGARSLAGVVQAAVSVGLGMLVYRTSRQSTPRGMAGMVLALTPAATPYAFDYDLAVLGLALIALTSAAGEAVQRRLVDLCAVTTAAATWGLCVFIATGERMNAAIALHPATTALLVWGGYLWWTTGRGTTGTGGRGDAQALVMPRSTHWPEPENA